MRIKLFIRWIFLLIPVLSQAQYPGIDSLKMSPVHPNVNDSVTIYAYVGTYDYAYNFGESVNVSDTSILVSSCYVNSQDFTQHWYIDTVHLGILAEGNYTLTYHFKQISIEQSDTPNFCATFPYYDSAYLHFSVTGTTAIDEITSTDFLKIYPNPVNNKLHFDFGNQYQGKLTGSVLNIAGQMLIQQHINPGGKREMNLESLPPGIYFLVLRDEKQQWIKKFVKE
ncbi:MAG: hypothetical protein JWO06_999 [Bacteroidota bacterium]|nr:hypothetical protein [Bacteroidota bacterium]